jgi:hypothetical protein
LWDVYRWFGGRRERKRVDELSRKAFEFGLKKDGGDKGPYGAAREIGFNTGA